MARMSDASRRPARRSAWWGVLLAVAVAAAGCPSDADPDETGGADAGQPDAAVDAGARGDATADAGEDGGDGAAGDASADADAAESLIDVEAFSQVEAGDDPLAEHRPDSVDCPSDAWGTEGLNREPTLTVSTGGCNYFAAGQPSRAAIAEGDRLRARVWHFELTASQGESAHVALAVGGEIVWEETVEIPSGSNLWAPEWTAEQAYPEGTPVVFHLHNHGSNSWNLIEFANDGAP